MTEEAEHEVVTQLRAGVVRHLEFAGPEATEFVLSHLKNVTYRNDVAAYLDEAKPVMAAALTLALQPTFDRLRRETADYREIVRQQEARSLAFEREFEEFRQLQTSDTKH